MTTALAEKSLTPAELDLITNTVARGATKEELQLFLYDCKRRNVHPLDKLIHFTKRGGRYTPITSIDFMRSRAADTGEYAGSDDAVMTDGENGHPVAARVTVYRLVQGQRCAFSATARWTEYYPGDQGGQMWRKMPHTMIAKCAEALALRKGFPQQLAGLYSSEEMDQADRQHEAGATDAVRNLRGASAVPSPLSDAAPTGEYPAPATPDAYQIRSVKVGKTGTKNGKAWTLFDIAVSTGEVFGTFSDEVAEAARLCQQQDIACEIDTEPMKRGKGRLIVSLSPVTQPDAPDVLDNEMPPEQEIPF